MPQVQTFEIHPSIGIARLGPSDEVFLAPEPDCTQAEFDGPGAVPPAPRTPRQDKYRDNAGLLKRQAARFRVFKVVRDVPQSGDVKIISCEEMHGTGVTINWTVHLANRKAAALQFLKLKEEPPQQVERNPGVPRNLLTIDAGPQTPTGSGVSTARKLEGKFMTGTPDERTVLLGHAWTDAEGRLMIAGGRGKSDTPFASPLDSFADNDGWYDDASDGPVTATIAIGSGSPQPVTGAWLVVAPFDFAPEIDSYITLYDVASEAAVTAAWLKMPVPGTTGSVAETSFVRDVMPVLARSRRYRWVNSWVLQGEGQRRHTLWREKADLDKLANPGDSDGSKWRKTLFAHLPDPADPDDAAGIKRQTLMPRIWDHDGDEWRVLALTTLQYKHFENWANDQFNTAPPAGEKEFLCDALDRIALDACSGGPFYPGIEAPDIMQEQGTYEAPFRILRTLQPGSITAGLAVPWQADFYECRMDGDKMWWPASRPDHVFLTEPMLPFDEQAEHEATPWAGGLESMDAMVLHWDKLGIVKKFPLHEKPVPNGTAATIKLADKMPEVDDPFLNPAQQKFFFFYEDERGATF